MLCNLTSQLSNGIVNCLMRSTWGTIRNVNYFVNMEKYLQQVSHSLGQYRPETVTSGRQAGAHVGGPSCSVTRE